MEGELTTVTVDAGAVTVTVAGTQAEPLEAAAAAELPCALATAVEDEACCTVT